MIPDRKLDFWIQNNYNVILRGYHGVGKTAMIKSAFERNGLKWMYFSAATMDPWVDFVGVPKERVDENGNVYLDLVRPKAFADDQVEAIFMDEFNRSSSKVRNAVMELIQFKSINGKVFKNLKIVWGAVNPEDKENEETGYNVEAIDPAQLDRFHVIYDVPYNMDKAYFAKKFTAKLANAAYSWWHSLDEKQKFQISPRRMDYTLECFLKKGDLRDILPKEVNIQKLILEIENGSFEEQMRELLKVNDIEKMREYIAVENNFANCKNLLISKTEFRVFLPLLSSEKLTKLMTTEKNILNYVCQNETIFKDLIRSVVFSKANSYITNQLKKRTNIWKDTTKPFVNTDFDALIDGFYINNKYKSVIEQTSLTLSSILSNYRNTSMTTYYKRIAYNDLLSSVHASEIESNVRLCLDFLMTDIGSCQQMTIDRLKSFRDFVFHMLKTIKSVNVNDYERYKGMILSSYKFKNVLKIK